MCGLAARVSDCLVQCINRWRSHYHYPNVKKSCVTDGHVQSPRSWWYLGVETAAAFEICLNKLTKSSKRDSHSALTDTPGAAVSFVGLRGEEVLLHWLRSNSIKVLGTSKPALVRREQPTMMECVKELRRALTLRLLNHLRRVRWGGGRGGNYDQLFQQEKGWSLWDL